MVLLRGPLASDARRRRGFHAAHDGTWVGCRAHSRPTDDRAGNIRFAGLARADRKRSSTTAGATGRVLECRAGALALALDRRDSRNDGRANQLIYYNPPASIDFNAGEHRQGAK